MDSPGWRTDSACYPVQSPDLQQFSVDSAAAELEAILAGGLHRLGNPPVVRPCRPQPPVVPAGRRLAGCWWALLS